MERRHAVRYRLEVPAVFRWEDPPGVRHKRQGVTRDISVSSAFLRSSTLPPLESKVEVEIAISAFPEARKAWLKGIMKVLRLEDNQQGAVGFSVAGEAFSLCTDTKG